MLVDTLYRVDNYNGVNNAYNVNTCNLVSECSDTMGTEAIKRNSDPAPIPAIHKSAYPPVCVYLTLSKSFNNKKAQKTESKKIFKKFGEVDG